MSGGNYHAGREKAANTIGRRIAEARRARGLSLADMSEGLARYGVSASRSAVNKWELGTVCPSSYQLLAICELLDIEDVPGYFAGHRRTDLLNEAGRQKLREYREDLIASGRYRERPGFCPELRYRNMPVSCLPASAGTGNYLDEDAFEMIAFPEDSIPEKAEFGVRVSGDSMEPVFHDGQIVWVQRCSRLRPGEVGLMVYDGCGYIKSYSERVPEGEAAEPFTDSSGTVHPQPVLVSYNKAYPPRPVLPHAKFEIIGRVLRLT